MAKHKETHPQYVDGCFGCKAASVDVGGLGLLRFSQHREADITEQSLGREIVESAEKRGRPIEKANKSDIGPIIT